MLELTRFLTLFAVTVALSGGSQPADVVESEFVGSTPCDAAPRRFLEIPDSASCERITWQLAFSAPTAPSTFRLRIVYGMQARNEPGFQGGGTGKELNGAWSVVAGPASEPRAIVYRLTLNEPARSLELRKLGDNLLHLLNQRRTLMVGNGGWSYTLSRKGGVARRDVPVRLERTPGAHAGAAGVFDGRSPCQPIASQLSSRQGDDCTKLKWRLQLYQDEVSGAPTRYILEGTLYRSAPRTGKWAILTSKEQPNVVIYQLDPDESGGFLSFVMLDNNVLFFLDKDRGLLVGDTDSSYTLNRVSG